MLVVFWLAIVAPQIVLGYGSHGDSWLVGRAALQMWSSGRYVASRSTGFPLFEILVTPLVHAGGWYLSNLLSLVAGLALLCAFFRLADRGELSHPFPAVLSMAFLPVVVTHSASTMDYVPALALMVWAYVLLLEGRIKASAVLIGLACGFRPTSELMILPWAIYVWKARRNLRAIAQGVLLAAVVGTIAYSPVLLTYGIRTIHLTIQVDVPTRVLIGGYSALELLGIVQSVVVAAVLLYSLRRGGPVASVSGSPWYAFHVSNIGVWIPLFLAMPYKSAYLMPLLPSLILLLDRLAGSRAFAWLCALLLSYHLIRLDALGGESGRRYVKLSLSQGYTIADIQDRRFKLATRRAATTCLVKRPTVLMLGDLWIPIGNDAWNWDGDLGMFRRGDGLLYVTGRILDEQKLKDLERRGYRLVVWRGDKWEYVRGCDFDWRRYVEIIDKLPDFFGTPIEGRALTDR